MAKYYPLYVSEYHSEFNERMKQILKNDNDALDLENCSLFDTSVLSMELITGRKLPIKDVTPLDVFIAFYKMGGLLNNKDFFKTAMSHKDFEGMSKKEIKDILLNKAGCTKEWEKEIFYIFDDFLKNSFIADNFNIKNASDIRDFLFEEFFFDKWRHHKQVYKINNVFADAIKDTENIKLTKEDIEHLPCDTFWLDVSECKSFQPMEGILVSIISEKDCYSVVMYQFHNEENGNPIYFSTYHEIDKLNEYIKYMNNNTCNYEFFDKKTLKKDSISSFNSRVDNTLLAYQIIAYLVSEKPDILLNKQSASVYKPRKEGAKPRDSFNEIIMEDIGYTFGAEFSKYQKAVKEYERQEMKRSSNEKEKNNTKTYKPVKPHFVRAHWSRYWTGKGRTTCELRWLEPYYTGLSKDAAAVFATIHNVK